MLRRRRRPPVAAEPPVTLARRDVLKVMAASLALATGGCGRVPLEKIVPYRDGPAQDGYGKPVFYASALERDGYGCGVLVETNMGRPTKIEGNPSHPASLGATDIFAQAAVLELWDPDRSTAHWRRGAIDTWPHFAGELQERLRASADGDGVVVLTETVTSPTLHDQLAALLARYPRAAWHQYQPINRDAVYAGARLAFGEALEPTYRFAEARVIVALDADVVTSMPGAVRYARDIAGARRIEHASRMSRLYVAEGTPSLTGALADDRLVVRTRDIAALTARLAARLGGSASAAGGGDATPEARAWLDAVAADLERNRGHAIVVAGDRQPAAVHAGVHALNQALGNDALVDLRAPVAYDTHDQVDALRALVAAMRGGRVTTLLMLGGNPVYAAPRDLGFGDALARVAWTAHLAPYRDETSAACTWHVAAAHALESWGDARAYDGSVTIRQPAIAPLYDGKSAHEVLSVLVDGNPRGGHDIVREFWQRDRAHDFDAFWRDALQSGVAVAAPAARARRVAATRARRAARRGKRPPRASSSCWRRIRRSVTAATPTTRGCRSCRSRSPRSPGATPPGSRRARRRARTRQRGHGRDSRRRDARARAGVDRARTCRRVGHAAPRPWPHPRRPRRRPCRRRRLRAAAIRRRAASSTASRCPRSTAAPVSPPRRRTTGWKGATSCASSRAMRPRAAKRAPASLRTRAIPRNRSTRTLPTRATAGG